MRNHVELTIEDLEGEAHAAEMRAEELRATAAALRSYLPGAAKAELVVRVTSPSPSPRPSPLGRGRTVRQSRGKAEPGGGSKRVGMAPSAETVRLFDLMGKLAEPFGAAELAEAGGVELKRAANTLTSAKRKGLVRVVGWGRYERVKKEGGKVRARREPRPTGEVDVAPSEKERAFRELRGEMKIHVPRIGELDEKAEG